MKHSFTKLLMCTKDVGRTSIERVNFATNYFARVAAVVVMMLTMSVNVWAEKGFFSDNAWNLKYYSGGGGDSWIGQQSNGATYDLGIVTTLYWKGGWVKTWSNNSWTQSNVVCSYTLPSGGKDPDITVNKSNVQGDQTWEYDCDKNLLSGIQPGVHKLKMTFKLDNYVSSNECALQFTIPGFTLTEVSQSDFSANVGENQSKTISFTHHYGTALQTSNCVISGTDASMFTVTGISETGVTVKFSPTSAGTKTASLTITDAHSKTCTISLSGTGIAAVTKYYIKGQAVESDGDWHDYHEMTYDDVTGYYKYETSYIISSDREFVLSNQSTDNSEWFKPCTWKDASIVGVTCSGSNFGYRNNAKIRLNSGYTTPVTIWFDATNKQMWAVATASTPTPDFTMQANTTYTVGDDAITLAISDVTGSPTSYQWSVTSDNASNATFGSATAASTTFSATQAGTYTVKMAATNAGGTTEKTCTITVATAPSILAGHFIYNKWGVNVTTDPALTGNYETVTIDGSALDFTDNGNCFFAFTTVSSTVWNQSAQYNAGSSDNVEVSIGGDGKQSTFGSLKAFYITNSSSDASDYNYTFKLDVTTLKVYVTREAKCTPSSFTLKHTTNGKIADFTSDTPNEYEVTFELKNDIINNLYVEDNCGNQYGCSDAIQPGKCITLTTAQSSFNFQSASQDKHWHYTFNSSTLELCSDATPEEEKGFVVTYASGANGTMTAVKTENSTTVPSGSTVPNNTSVTFTAIPNGGYEFSGWYAESDFSGAQISSDNPYVVNITADYSIYPKFTSNVTRITNLAVADANVGGKVTVTPTVENPQGTTYYYCYTVTDGEGNDVDLASLHRSCSPEGVLTFDAPAVGTYTVTLNLRAASDCSGEIVATASKKFEVRDNITTIYLLTMYDSNVSMWSYNRSDGFVVTEGTDNDHTSGYRIEMVKVGDVTIGDNTRYLYRASYSGTHKFIFYIKNSSMQENTYKISGEINGKSYINTSYYFDLKNVSYQSTTTKTYTESPFKSISNSLAQTEVYCAGVLVDLDAMLTTASSLKNSGATVTTTYKIDDAAPVLPWRPAAGTYTLKATSTDVSNIQNSLYAAAEATTTVNIKDCNKIVVTAHNNNCWAAADNFKMQMHYQSVAEGGWSSYENMIALPGFTDWYYYQFMDVTSVNNWQIKGYTSNVPGDYTQTMGELTESGCYTINRTADGESYKSNNQTMTVSDCPTISVSLAASATSNLPGSTITLTATEPAELNETGKAAAVYTYYYKSSKDKDWIKIADGAAANTSEEFTPDNTEAETYTFMVTVSYDNGMDIYAAQSADVKVVQVKPTLTVYIPNANKIVSGQDFSIAPYLDDYEGTPNVIVCYDIFENEDCTSRATYTDFVTLTSNQGVKTSISTIGTYYVKVTVKNECGGKEIVSVVTPITIVADYIELKVDGETLVGSTIRFTATSSSVSTTDFVFTQKQVTSDHATTMGTVHHTEAPYPSGYVDYAFDSEGTYDVTVTRGELTATVRIYVTEASYFFSPTDEADSYVIMSRMDDGRYYVVNPYVNDDVYVATSSTGTNKETIGTSNVTKPGGTKAGDTGIYIYSPITSTTTLEFVKDALYRVASDYNDGQDTYYSNIVTASVSTDAANVSFFAQQAGKLTLEKLYPANDTVKWTKVGDLSHAGIKSDDVYTAILNPSAGTISGTARYTGNFYIYGAVPTYTPGDANKSKYWTQEGAGQMTKFTKVTETEFFNHYFCRWVNHDNTSGQRKCNFAATVGNEINHNLAHMLGKKMMRGVSVRYGYDNTTNYFGRAFLDGSTDNENFLRAAGTNMYSAKNAGTAYSDLGSKYATFIDISDYVYTSEVYAEPGTGNPPAGATIQLGAYHYKYNSGEDTPDYVLSEIDDPNYTYQFFGGYRTSGGYQNTRLRFLLTYDFKTNRFNAGWYPEGETISTDTEVDANLLVIRDADSKASAQLFTLNNNAKVTIVRQIFTVLELNRKNLFKSTGDHGYANGLRSQLFQISVPYPVHLQSIYGLPNYGSKWVIQDYRGEFRAKWAMNREYWFNVGWTESAELNNQGDYVRGYVLSHNFVYSDFSEITKKDVTTSLMRLMIPSPKIDGGYEIVGADMYENSRIPELPSSKVDQPNHSNWHVVGVPGFFAAQANGSKNFRHVDLDANGDPIYTPGEAVPQMSETANWVYEWGGEHGVYHVKDLSTYALNPTSCYMMQFAGEIDWTNGTYTYSSPARRVAPRYASNAENNRNMVDKYKVNLLNSDGDVEDETFVVLDPNGSKDFVMLADLQKVFTEGASQIYSITGNVNYAANDLPDTVKMVAMGINLPESGTYTFRLENTDQSRDMLLLDTVMHVYTDLTAGETYSFLGDAGNVTDRFYLVFGERKNPIETEIAQGELAGAQVSTIGNRIQVSGVPAGSSLTLIDMLGRIVYIDTASSESVVTPSLPTGVYHLLIQSNTDSSVAKVVIR